MRAAPSGDARAFLRTLDVLDVPLGFFSSSGTLVHANRSFRRMLEATRRDPHGLLREASQFARALWSMARLRGLTAGQLGAVEELGHREVSSAAATYRLRGSYLGLDLLGVGALLLIAVEPAGASLPSEGVLRRRWKLSPQEARVARLLATGRTNQEVAAALAISIHTARHHAARVRAKLGVHSRTQVAARLLGHDDAAT